jgi:trehalose 6-phosphate phosphatase
MAESIQAPPLPLFDDAALFLDFDGTLVELAETPDSIRVPPALSPLIQRLARRLDGRLAIISGRAIADLERYLHCSGIALSGSHGLELRLRDGSPVPLGVPPGLDQARERIARYAESIPDLLVEEKPFSLALHYRQVPEREGEVRGFMTELAVSSGLTLQHGKMVVEIRPEGADKGHAVRALMAEPEFADARPLFVGDDLTDENAFRAAAALGGGGILVGAERETAAKWRLDGVGAVVRWLEQIAGQ